MYLRLLVMLIFMISFCMSKMMMVMMHLGLKHVLEAGDVDCGRDYKTSRSLTERLGRVRMAKTWKQHRNQHYSNHFDPLFPH